jgi:hypothetical protein
LHPFELKLPLLLGPEISVAVAGVSCFEIVMWSIVRGDEVVTLLLVVLVEEAVAVVAEV